LLTCNRNRDGANSLEETIRRHNRPDCLPVFTVSDPSRFGTERDYDTRLAKDILEYLISIDELRGTGRLFVPFAIDIRRSACSLTSLSGLESADAGHFVRGIKVGYLFFSLRK